MATVSEQTTNGSSTEDENSETVPLVADTSGIAKVLLIGGTGSGKSTFINYLTNYFKGGTLDNLKIAIPSHHFPHPTEGYPHNEDNLNDLGQSQTNACRQYFFSDTNNEKKYIFIDTPGLGDTRGISQDDINIDKVQDAVLDLGALTAAVIIMNGTNVRVDTSMKRVLTLLARSLPDIVMQSVILILTNTDYHSATFNPSILPLYGSTIYVFNMQNSAFSRPAKDRSSQMLHDLRRDWDNSMKEIKRILAQIDSFTAVAADTLAGMKAIRDAIRTKMQETMLQIRDIQQMQKQLVEYENKSKEYNDDKMSFKDYIQQEKLKTKNFVPSSTLNTICYSCHTVCHENCKINEISRAGDQLFMHCIAMQEFRHKCSVCPNQCSFTQHYHTRHTIEEIELTQERVLHDIKERYDQAVNKLENIQEKIITVKQAKETLDASIHEKCEDVKTTCRQLKEICQGFDLAQELCAVIELMQAESLQLLCMDDRTKIKEYIQDLCVFCDRLQKTQDKKKDYAKPKIIYRSREIDTITTKPTFSAASKEKTDELVRGIEQLLIVKQKPASTSNSQLPSNVVTASPVALTSYPVPIHSRDWSDNSSDISTQPDSSSDYITSYNGPTDSITIYDLPSGMTRHNIARTLSRCGPIRVSS